MPTSIHIRDNNGSVQRGWVVWTPSNPSPANWPQGYVACRSIHYKGLQYCYNGSRRINVYTYIVIFSYTTSTRQTILYTYSYAQTVTHKGPTFWVVTWNTVLPFCNTVFAEVLYVTLPARSWSSLPGRQGCIKRHDSTYASTWHRSAQRKIVNVKRGGAV